MPNQPTTTREAKRENDVVWGMYVDLDKPALLDKIWDRGFDAGAASIDRVEIVREAFEKLKLEVKDERWIEALRAMDAVIAAMEEGK